jgi:hypothetical protein
MRPRSNVYTLRDWCYDPKRRAHRFRCQGCARVIDDHTDVVVERRGRSSHGYHADCFNGLAAEAALARDAERMAARS